MWLGYLDEFPDYMTQGETLEELQKRITRLHREKMEKELLPRQETRRLSKEDLHIFDTIKRLLSDNWLMKLLAFSLAVMLWFYLRRR